MGSYARRHHPHFQAEQISELGTQPAQTVEHMSMHLRELCLVLAFASAGAQNLDLRRQQQVVSARATDHAADVMLAKIPGFTLAHSIFAHVPGALDRSMMTTKLEFRPYWNNDAVASISSAYQHVPPSPPVNSSLLEFMNTKCDFKVEHADGTFLDHLYFCYDYAVAHYPAASPLVPFLHSILGAGTNYFPMNASLIAELQSFLTDEEWLYISSFPSFLRLVIQRELIRELAAMPAERLKALSGIQVYRVIDNQPLQLTAEQMWVQLNYQLAHELDFLPVSSWDVHAWDPFLGEYDELYDMLLNADQLRVDIKQSVQSNFTDYPPGQPVQTAFTRFTTVGSKQLQYKIAQQQAAKQVQDFSKAIGHNISYEFVF